MCYTTRMRASARVGTAVALVAVLLGACSSSSPKSAGTTTTKPSTGTHAVPTSFKELQARIVTKVPSGFVAQAPGAYDTGPSDLAKAIRDDGGPNAGKILRAEKFVRGYQRIWIGPEHAQIIVFVYQFDSRVGARRDYARYTRVFDSKLPPGTHRFVIGGLPASQSLGVAGSDKTGGAALAYFTKGVFNVEINCNAPTTAGLQAQATAIAKDQYNRL